MYKKVIAGVLAFSTLFGVLLAACAGGSPDRSQSETALTQQIVVTSQKTSDSTSTGTTKAASDTETTTSEKTDLSSPVSNDISADEATEIADKALVALRNSDLDSIIKYTTMGEYIRFENPDATTEEIIAAYDAAIESDSEGSFFLTFVTDGDNFNMKVKDAVPVTENELTMITDFVNDFIVADENLTYNPKITGGYKFNLEFPDDGKDYDREANLYVLNVNGTYQLDLCYTLLMETYCKFTQNIPEDQIKID